MLKRTLWSMVCLCMLGSYSFAQRDVTARDLKGIPNKHRYLMAVLGGTAVGAGIGIIAPGGNKSLAKGAMIGGSGASFLYLMTHRRTASEWRSWAHIGTNTVLGSGIGWTMCNCKGGALAGALLGGGATAILQSMGHRNNPATSAIPDSLPDAPSEGAPSPAAISLTGGHY